jgi:nickel/cobalt exporter
MILAAVVPAALAHPLPSFQFDRTGVVRFQNGLVEIDYTLDISLFAMALDAKGLFTRDDEQRIGGRQKEFAKAYGDKKGPLIADELRVKMSDKEVSLKSRLVSVTFEDTHAKFQFTFTSGPVPAGRFTLHDQSFEDKPGALVWSFASAEGLSDITQPTDLRSVSPLDMTAEQAARRRSLAATVVAPKPVEMPPADVGPVELPREGLVRALTDRGLVAFFDSDAGTGVLLLAALVFGMAHAVTPGHGKTLVAAYLVGEKGTIGHALVLGLTTTLAHTGSVILLAVVLRHSYRDGVPQNARAVLQLLGGLLIFLVGLWLLLQRLRGRADHVHLNTGQRGEGKKPFGWLRVILLGLAGGMIPCWDAVLLLLVAISAGRLAYALPLLLSFSVGLSAVLVALGVGVVLTTRAGGRSFGEARWFKLLPTLSALVLVLVGIWFVRDGFHTFE